MRTLSVGAEARIYADDAAKIVVKRRRPKRYRLKQLDEKLRLFRTKREAKVMEKLQQIGLAVPKIISISEKTATIKMQLIEGEKVKDVLNSSNNNSKKVCEEVGRNAGTMHKHGIIHGDLTTTNMIYGSKEKKVYFVDFGLSLFSAKTEDKAVDLHLFKQSLKMCREKAAALCFAAAVKGYRETNSDWQEVLKRLEVVEARGRYKGKGRSYEGVQAHKTGTFK